MERDRAAGRTRGVGEHRSSGFAGTVDDKPAAASRLLRTPMGVALGAAPAIARTRTFAPHAGTPKIAAALIVQPSGMSAAGAPNARRSSSLTA